MPTETDKLTAYRLSTDDLPQRNREAIWREVYGRTLMGLDFERLDEDPLRCEVAMRTLPGLAVGSMTTAGMRIGRDRELVAADGNEIFYVNLLQEGTALPSQLGRDLRVGDGDVVLMTNAEPGMIDFPSEGRFVSLQIPRAALAPLVADIDDAVLRPIPRNTEAVRLLTRYVALLEQGPVPRTPELQHLMIAHVCDLVAVALGTTGQVAERARNSGVRAARLSAIKADIVRKLGHEELSVGTVASRHGLTPRYIQMLFEGEGMTYSEFVLRQRIAYAQRLLTHPRFADGPISAIAYRVGFGDLSYFNRSFRRICGATPSEVREEARRQGGG